jgi:hypothetical protein
MPPSIPYHAFHNRGVDGPNSHYAHHIGCEADYTTNNTGCQRVSEIAYPIRFVLLWSIPYNRWVLYHKHHGGYPPSLDEKYPYTGGAQPNSNPSQSNLIDTGDKFSGTIDYIHNESYPRVSGIPTPISRHRASSSFPFQGKDRQPQKRRCLLRRTPHRKSCNRTLHTSM